MILIRFTFLQVFPPVPTFVFATSFRGFSPTRPTERERGRAGEILGNEVVVFALLFKKKKKKTLSFFSSLLICPLARLKPPTSFPGENPGNEVVKPPASQVSQAIELYVNLCVKFSKCKVRRPPLSEI